MKLRPIIYAATAALLLANGIYSYRAYCSDAEAGDSSKAVVAAADEKTPTVEEQLEILMQVMEMIRRNHVDGASISEHTLLTNAIRGMAMSMDPFSEYMPPREYKDFNEESEGIFGGIGVHLDSRDGRVVVVSTMEGKPAAIAGMRAGDQIVEIDGTAVDSKDYNDVSERLRGEVGTEVTLGIRRADADELLHFTMQRAEIALESVLDEHIVEGSTIGYLRVAEFTQNTPREFEAALREMQSQAVEGLVIDLRGNPGGLLESARQMCSYFLPNSVLVVSVEGRTPADCRQNMSSSDYKFPEHLPVVILLNGGSASAAEIMASCLNDYDRAGLVGERSFGKGSVQNTIGFPDGSALKLTIAKYYTKSRRKIHGEGILPEMACQMTNEQYQALYETTDTAEADKKDAHLQQALEYIGKYRGKPSLYRQENPPQPDEEEQPETAEESPAQE